MTNKINSRTKVLEEEDEEGRLICELYAEQSR